jgi:hypothetical protein
MGTLAASDVTFISAVQELNVCLRIRRPDEGSECMSASAEHMRQITQTTLERRQSKRSRNEAESVIIGILKRIEDPRLQNTTL